MPATYRFSSYRAEATWRGRAASIALATAAVALVVLALLRLGGIIQRAPGDGRPLITFDVSPAAREERAAGARRTVTQRRERAARAAQPRRTTTEPPPPSPVPEESLADLKLPGVIQLSSADFRASDIGRIKGSADAGALAGTEGESDPAVGTGPGGEPMYAAEWYREPSHAELSTYMPPNRAGWGVVACRTATRFHVEDCRELGETPGSGIARGVRQAAWQFLVRPPRKGGRPLIGAWVRIRIDLTAREER